MPNIIEIIDEALLLNSFDGLFNPDGECACRCGDLAPCGNIGESCEAGYLARCDCGEHKWHIMKDKPGLDR